MAQFPIDQVYFIYTRRPCPSPSFLGKTIETAAKKQLIAHMETLNVLPEDQSAYREFHSTETALCSIVSDLLEYMDNGKCAILILLNPSAALDTVDHKLLIDDLMYIGVEGVALNWFKSYLENRSYHVIINGTKSERRTLQRGVPQGSVLGPVLFSIYTIELAWILKQHSVKFKMFVNDTQFYFINDVEDTISALNSLVCDIKQWMAKKKLKLNEKKTECLIIGTKHDITKYDELKEVSINNQGIVLSRSVRDLGFAIDNNLTCNEQIQTVIKNANFSLRIIAFIKKYLDDDSMKTFVLNYIITRLDYCNSLYHELPVYQLKKLQLVFNRAARLIVGTAPRERITPVLIDLHWLPIKARIVFKICVLTYIALNTGKPNYLRNKLSKFTTELGVSIRHSHDPHRLNEPMNKEIGTRSFKYSAPRLFNSLPRSVKDWKSQSY